MSGRACGATSARWSDHLDDAGFAGNFLIVQSTGGLFDVERRAAAPASACWNPDPAAGVIGTKALCDRIGLENAIAFDMGGTTAKAGVIHRRPGADDRQRADRRLCHRSARADADDRHPGGRHRRRQHRPRRDRRRVACRSGKRGRRSPVRSATGAAAPSRPSPMPTSCSAGSAPIAFSAARCGSIVEGAEARSSREGRAAARPRSDRGGRRHPAHRHHQNVPCGALGDHRARPRRRRLRARRLRRRRPAARRRWWRANCASRRS